MRLSRKYLLISILVIGSVYVFQNFESIFHPQVAPTKQETLVLSPTPTVLSSTTELVSLCKVNGVLPDPNCTPGSIDPLVTQENINSTICVKGYTATVRPKVTYTNKLKVDQIKEYGYLDTNPKDYEEDHLISLELGGNPTDPKNLWPEPGMIPNPKDKIENLCHQKVCDGEILLSEAQRQISTDWTTACK